MEDQKTYSQKEILNMFNIHRQTLNNWRRNGTIKYKKINNRKFLYYLLKSKIIQENESSKNLLRKRNNDGFNVKNKS